VVPVPLSFRAATLQLRLIRSDIREQISNQINSIYVYAVLIILFNYAAGFSVSRGVVHPDDKLRDDIGLAI